jgi:hypothetical protein
MIIYTDDNMKNIPTVPPSIPFPFENEFIKKIASKEIFECDFSIENSFSKTIFSLHEGKLINLQCKIDFICLDCPEKISSKLPKGVFLSNKLSFVLEKNNSLGEIRR